MPSHDARCDASTEAITPGNSPPKQPPACPPPPCPYKGVRQRKWGKFVSEVREPNKRTRIWLGSFESAEEAARAYDMAARLLRGSTARLNFPDRFETVQLPPGTAETLLKASREAAKTFDTAEIADALERSLYRSQSESQPSEELPQEQRTLETATVHAKVSTVKNGAKLSSPDVTNLTANVTEPSLPSLVVEPTANGGVAGQAAQEESFPVEGCRAADVAGFSGCHLSSPCDSLPGLALCNSSSSSGVDGCVGSGTLLPKSTESLLLDLEPLAGNNHLRLEQDVQLNGVNPAVNAVNQIGLFESMLDDFEISSELGGLACDPFDGL